MRRWAFVLLLPLLVIGMSVGCGATEDMVSPPATTQPRSSEALHVIWVGSYYPDDIWSLQIQSGMLEEFARNGYRRGDGTLEWEAVHLSMKQYASLSDILLVADEIIAQIATFRPDLVIVSDDEAARTVISRYPDSDLPFVYCGLNVNPEVYDLVRPNVTGVREVFHPVQTLEIARAFVGGTGKYMILGDASPTGMISALDAFHELTQRYPDLPSPTFLMTNLWEEWQDAVLAAADLDFILLTNVDFVWVSTGNYIEQREMLAWMVQNSPVPVFALSNQAVVYGAVASLVPSGYDQGVKAAEIAIRIAQGTSPAAIAPDLTAGNLLVMNLAAAENWNLRIPIAFPLAARVYRTLPASQGGQ